MPTRKRHSGITLAEALLGRVIRTLETDDRPLQDPDRAFPLLRAYHGALVDLLANGPLHCPDAVAREREETDHPTLSPTEVGILRAVLLQLLRSTVRGAPTHQASSRIGTSRALTFRAHASDRRVRIAAEGDVEDLIVLQMVLLLQEVGLGTLRTCDAPDCQRLFVKVYRRQFCSVACQKRINARKQRRNAQEYREQLARRRRQRRQRGA